RICRWPKPRASAVQTQPCKTGAQFRLPVSDRIYLRNVARSQPRRLPPLGYRVPRDTGKQRPPAGLFSRFARSPGAECGVFSGVFQTGEGCYSVQWSLIDDLGRVCRQEWSVDAHLTTGERSEKVAMPSDTAGDLSWRPTETSGAVTKSRRVTILLNTAIPALRD